MHSLDCLRLVTHGTPLTLHNLLAHLSPAQNAISYVQEEKGAQNLYAQVLQRKFAMGGQFSFITWRQEADAQRMIELIERVISTAGEWGVYYLLADLPEEEPFPEAFAAAGFRVWTHQRIYLMRQADIQKTQQETAPKYAWRTWTSADIPAMQQLYRMVVPGLFQNIEPLTRRAQLGMVVYDESQHLLGYVDIESGPRGVWAQPVVAPTMSDPSLIVALIADLPDVFGRPVSLAVRSYQPWLRNMADQLPHQGVGQQTLLVRYLAMPKLAFEPDRELVFEGAVPTAGRSQVSQADQSSRRG
ncbi:MAG: hypothetical protein GXY37_00465 [Chloroflexi bacterium]|nr:hypothetical protein [Chloroflexota bacterium]